MKTHPGRALAITVPLLILPLAFAGSPEKFEAMDADGDGKISRAEHRNAAEKMFKQMDKNRDGVVSSKELRAATETTDGTGVAIRERLRKMDRNADGRITDSEHSSASYTMFSDFDTDNDRFLSAQELEAGHERAMKEENS